MSYRIVKHRGGYSIAYGRPRVRRSLGTSDAGVAEARAKSYWLALSTPSSDKTEDLWKAYVADRQAEGVPTKNHKRVWAHLEPHFGYKLGDQIVKADCHAYTAHRRGQKAADSTIRQELELLRACLNLRYGRGQTHLALPPASPPRDRFLTKEEVEKLMQGILAPHVELFVVLALTTGARMTAILEAEWSQVDFSTNTINFLPAGRVQTNKRRTTVPLNSRARAALEAAAAVAKSPRLIEYDGKGIDNIKWAIRRAGRRAGVPCSPHVFRHTAGVWMAQADLPMQKISQYLGHTSTRVTEQVYARYSPSYMKDASDALDW